VREMEAQHAIARESGVGEQSTPWLAFDIHHGTRASNVERASGLTLAAKAVLSGSLAVLVGPSGAGKTSLLRSIAGLMRPRRGYVRVAGTTVWDSEQAVWLRPAQRGCGLVTQRSALFPAMTARDNIAFGLHAFSREERERRVREMAALFRLEAVLSRRPAQLSGGEQQRVAIARALVNRPKILLADEPTGNLDSATGEAILALLREQSARGMTIVMVTHERSLAEKFADRLAIMGDGKLLSTSLATGLTQ
jgi:ABC-type sugar transport system ATPase subunit